MTPYRINEADLQIGPDWQDQSLQVFKLPSAPAGKEASFVVSRDLSRKNYADFAAYVAKQREQLTEKLPGFKLNKDESIQYQDHDGAWLEYTWRSGENELLIRQVFYDRQNLTLIFTLTAAPSDSAHFDETWRRTMSATVLQPKPLAPVSAPFPPPEAIVKKAS
jgi:hypothetical protein